jgi:hypothetical protein
MHKTISKEMKKCNQIITMLNYIASGIIGSLLLPIIFCMSKHSKYVCKTRAVRKKIMHILFKSRKKDENQDIYGENLKA